MNRVGVKRRSIPCTIRAVLAFIKPYKNVIDYELLPYHRFGLGRYELMGEVYELDDFKTPSDELVQQLQAIIDEAFGRSGTTDKVKK